MTMERYAIGLDLGTSSVKAVLFSTEKGVVAKDSAAFTYAPAYLPDGSEYGEEGKWDFDDNEMSKDTATIIMRLSFPNPDRLLIPNSYVTLLTDRKTPPKMAIMMTASRTETLCLMENREMFKISPPR